MRRDLPSHHRHCTEVWWSRPYHHAVAAPGQYLVPLPGMEYGMFSRMVWYVTNRRARTVRIKGKDHLALIGVYGLFLPHGGFMPAQPAKPVKLDYQKLPQTDLLTIGFGKLHLLVRWPIERWGETPVSHLDGMPASKAPIGYIVDGRVRPFTTLQMEQRLTWEQIEALHEGCRHGHWFMWGAHVYFTDERSAVYARLLAGEVLR